MLQLWLSAGKRLLADGRADEATRLFERVVLDSDSPSVDPQVQLAQQIRLIDALAHLALAHVETGRFVEAGELVVGTAVLLDTLADTGHPSLAPLRRLVVRVGALMDAGMGHHERSAEQFRHLIRSFRGLDTNDPAISAELAVCLEGSAANALADGDIGTAAGALNAAIHRWRLLTAIDEPATTHRLHLVDCLRRLADVEQSRGARRDADKLRAEANRAEWAARGEPSPLDETRPLNRWD